MQLGKRSRNYLLRLPQRFPSPLSEVYYFIMIHEDVGKISSEWKGEEIENADQADSISDTKELKPSNLIMPGDTSTTEARRKSETAHHNPHKGPENV